MFVCNSVLVCVLVNACVSGICVYAFAFVYNICVCYYISGCGCAYVCSPLSQELADFHEVAL